MIVVIHSFIYLSILHSIPIRFLHIVYYTYRSCYAMVACFVRGMECYYHDRVAASFRFERITKNSVVVLYNRDTS